MDKDERPDLLEHAGGKNAAIKQFIQMINLVNSGKDTMNDLLMDRLSSIEKSGFCKTTPIEMFKMINSITAKYMESINYKETGQINLDEHLPSSI